MYVNCSIVFDSATLWTVACQPPFLHVILQAEILEWVAIPFSKGSSRAGTDPGSPSLQADSLLSEPPGKPNEF